MNPTPVMTTHAKQTRRRRRRVGRPPRRDHPMDIRVTLPGAMRRWLRMRAASEMRDQSAIVVDGLTLYRERGGKS